MNNYAIKYMYPSNLVYYISFPLNPNPANILVPEMLSAFHLCCIYSGAPRLDFIMETKTMSLIRLLPMEQSDLGPYCLQNTLPKNMCKQESR